MSLTNSNSLTKLNFHSLFISQYNKVFPEDPYEQLYNAVFAVFDSWESSRAIKYRQVEGITGLLGTAVNVQAMCFGNMGGTSGTGVCFTRDPTTGERKLYGEYLVNAQGEDGKFSFLFHSFPLLSCSFYSS